MKLRIEPGEGKHTRGTKVMLDDVELNGVQGVTIKAEVGSLWAVSIDCLVEFDPLTLEVEQLDGTKRQYRKVSRLELLKGLFLPRLHVEPLRGTPDRGGEV